MGKAQPVAFPVDFLLNQAIDVRLCLTGENIAQFTATFLSEHSGGMGQTHFLQLFGKS